MRLSDKVVLVTGGGTGIGRASALRLAGEGARVAVLGRRSEPLEDAATAVRESGGEALVVRADVRSDEEVRGAVARTVDRYGGIDALVNNAGYVPEWSLVQDTSDQSWGETLDINLTGAFRMCRAVLPHLVERGGAIVNISSISAVKALHSVAPYAAAKAGLIALTRCIAAEYGWQGVRCNCIVPSWIETPMTAGFLEDDAARQEVARRHALQRVGTPDEVARAVVYLVSEESSFVTGAAHPVDGGMSAL
jgi:NAD(P)-dependent dehydrogenase (short-subunit alcohol dehydrogenase family)